MVHKIVGVAIFGSVVLFIFCSAVFAAGTYDDGDGSAEFPYEIAKPNQLIYMSEHPEDWDKQFILTADLNLALAEPNTFTTALIAPDTVNSNYEHDGTPFTGVFDGNGHIISNLTIDDTGAGNDYLGLFGYINGATAKKIVLIKVDINAGPDTFFVGSFCGRNSGNITECYANGSVSGRGGSTGSIGVLCGDNYNGSISNCFTGGSVNGGDGTSNQIRYLGGLCGSNYNGTINNCYSNSSVTGKNTSWNFGGLCGANINSSISKCYSSGSVSSGDDFWNLGGLCGYNDNGSFINCYFLDSAGPDNGLGTPLTDPNMMIQNKFVGWDFVGDANGSQDYWQLCIDGYDYPRLAWQFINPADFLHPGRVDNYDLFVLTHDWLTTDSRCCDIGPGSSGDGIVNLFDFHEFSKYWLEE